MSLRLGDVVAVHSLEKRVENDLLLQRTSPTIGLEAVAESTIMKSKISSNRKDAVEKIRRMKERKEIKRYQLKDGRK